jgi:hypothetical protein
MGTDVSGQVAICMKSNIGYINKKSVDVVDITRTKPEWCPILDAKTVKHVIGRIECAMRTHTDTDSKYLAIRSETWDRIKEELLA